MDQKIPYKIYLEEKEMPKQWYNVRADMKKKPAPILNPATLKPVSVDELIKCIVRLRLYVHIVWKRSWIRRHIFTTNLKEIIHQEAIN